MARFSRHRLEGQSRPHRPGSAARMGSCLDLGRGHNEKPTNDLIHTHTFGSDKEWLVYLQCPPKQSGQRDNFMGQLKEHIQVNKVQNGSMVGDVMDLMNFYPPPPPPNQPSHSCKQAKYCACISPLYTKNPQKDSIKINIPRFDYASTKMMG